MVCDATSDMENIPREDIITDQDDAQQPLSVSNTLHCLIRGLLWYYIFLCSWVLLL